jgi:hypothetical protein
VLQRIIGVIVFVNRIFFSDLLCLAASEMFYFYRDF